ncbi:MAG: ankyrin repeat domain-containing protein [Bradymonadaceae bacterium]|nr:ankyrin repeat domain-containing protein [Lujinxingiaceae bacterium]
MGSLVSILALVGALIAMAAIGGLWIDRRDRARAPHLLADAQEAINEHRYVDALRCLEGAFYVPVSSASFGEPEAHRALAALDILERLQEVAEARWIECTRARHALNAVFDDGHLEADSLRPIHYFLESAAWNPTITYALVEASLRTPLLRAASKGDLDRVKTLLDAGAAVDDASALDSSTPLIAAAAGGHTDVVALLLERGANVNATNFQAYSPLSIALSNQVDARIALMLVERGADVNVATHTRKATALMLAAGTDNLELVQKLVEHGARLGERDVTGQTVFDWAGHEVARFLTHEAARERAR